MIKLIAFDFGGTLFSTSKMGSFTDEMVAIFVQCVIELTRASETQAKLAFEQYRRNWVARRHRGSERPEVETGSLDLLRAALDQMGISVSESS
jgi:hypothetical protein